MNDLWLIWKGSTILKIQKLTHRRMKNLQGACTLLHPGKMVRRYFPLYSETQAISMQIRIEEVTCSQNTETRSLLTLLLRTL